MPESFGCLTTDILYIEYYWWGYLMLSIYPAIYTIVAVLNWIIIYTNIHSCNNLTPQFLIQYKHTQSESTQGWFSWLFINRYVLYIFVNCWYQKGHLCAWSCIWLYWPWLFVVIMVSSHQLVCRSKCKSYVGLHGIVIQETQNTFKMICKDDKVRSECDTSNLLL